MVDTDRFETHVYLLPIGESSRIPESFFADHFPLRLEKAKRFRFPEDRFRSLGVGALLWGVLGLEEADLGANKYGKPFAKKSSCKTSCFFSISHSGDYTALAVSPVPIGVDVEKINPDHLSVSPKVLTQKESEWIEADPVNRFFTLWTMKESLGKMTGQGMNYPYAATCVLPLVNGEALGYGGTAVYGRTVLLSNHVLSLCTEGGNPSLYLHEVSSIGKIPPALIHDLD